MNVDGFLSTRSTAHHAFMKGIDFPSKFYLWTTTMEPMKKMICRGRAVNGNDGKVFGEENLSRSHHALDEYLRLKRNGLTAWI
ncbi:hypothetical protein COOONC_01611 [Cooperia oncophora]